MSRFSLAILLTVAPSLFAQKKEDFIALQRDVAQMQDQMKQLQKSQDEKMAALTTLLQQSMDAQARLSTNLASLEKNLNTAIADQQAKIAAPVAALGTKVDTMADGFSGVKENVAALSAQLSKLDAKLTDISLAIRTLNAPPVAPPPAAGAPTAQAQLPNAETLWENAKRDMSAGKNSLALDEFSDYAKFFPESENAPSAVYNIGIIYDRNDQHEEALKAFTDVVDKFPENPRTPDGLYMKGVQQMKTDHNTDAGATFREFLKRYPTNDKARKAQDHLRELGLAAPAKPVVRKKTR
jgi:TolA-binding protein